MNNDRIATELRASRTALEATDGWKRGVEERLQATVPGSSIGVLILGPIAIVLMVLSHSSTKPAPLLRSPDPVLTGPEWTTPMTAAEVMPWMQVRREPMPRAQAMAAFFAYLKNPHPIASGL